MVRDSMWERSWQEGLISALAVAGVLIILGLVIALTPDVSQKATAFIKDSTTVNYTVGNSTLHLPAPADPSAHISIFTSAMYFILGVAILELIILPIRLYIKSPVRRIAQSVGNVVFWVGAVVFANVFLLAGTLDGWFRFWAGILLLIGISLIARFAIYFTHRSSSQK